MKNPFVVNKTMFLRLINKKVAKKINALHIKAVLNILIEEMIKDLAEGKMIDIYNFGKITLKKWGPKKHHNFILKKIMISPGHKVLTFKMPWRIKKIIRKFFDLDKTFSSENNG
jgi:nucleoid DNA-binding protein